MPMRACGSSTVRTTEVLRELSTTTPTSPWGTVATMLVITPSWVPLFRVSRESRLLLLTPMTEPVRATPGDWSVWICSTSVSWATLRLSSRFSCSSCWMRFSASDSSSRRSERSASATLASRRLVPTRCSRLWGSATAEDSEAGGWPIRPLTMTVTSPRARKVNQARCRLCNWHPESVEQPERRRKRQTDDVGVAAADGVDQCSAQSLQAVAAGLVQPFATGGVPLCFAQADLAEADAGARRFLGAVRAVQQHVAGGDDVLAAGQKADETHVLFSGLGFAEQLTLQ